MPIALSNYWDGAWHPGAGESIERRAPARSDTVVASGAGVSSAQLDAAVGAAAHAFDAWRRLGIERRCAILRAAAGILSVRAEALGRELSHEQGKVLAEGVAEVRRAAAIFDYFGHQSKAPVAEEYAGPTSQQRLVVSHHPVGTIGVVTPWNFPIAIPAWKLAPALAYGNTVVWKPASHVPLLAFRLMEALEEAGLPPGVLSLTMGPGSIGQRIVESSQVDAVTFTGSTEVGRHLVETCGRRMKPIQAELGGKNVAVVAEDADLDQALEAILVGAFSGNGQKCTATSRVIVDERVADTFGRMLRERACALTVGDPLDPSTEVGPVVSSPDQVRIQAVIDAADGAVTVSAGDRRPGNGWFVNPTVVDLERPKGAFWTEEIFGPVVALVRANDYAEALRLADDTPFGLAAGVYTRSLDRVHQATEELKVGMLTINGPTTGSEPHVPFGGWKQSGFGPREQGSEARAFFTKSRTTAINAGTSR